MPRSLIYALLAALLIVGGWFVVAAAEQYLHFRSLGSTFVPAPRVKWRIMWWLVVGTTLLVSAAVVYVTLLRRKPTVPRGFDLGAGERLGERP